MKTRHQARSYWRGTPPRPRSDRTETAMFGTLMTAFLGGSPFVAIAAGRWVSARLSRKAEVQQASLRQVPATLLHTAPRCSGHGAGAGRDTPAHWRAPNGQLRTGPVPAPGGTTAGSTVRVWVNQAGDLAGPPMQETKIANRTELAQGLAAGLFAVGLGAIGRWAGRRLDQHRITALWHCRLAPGPRWEPGRHGSLRPDIRGLTSRILRSDQCLADRAGHLAARQRVLRGLDQPVADHALVPGAC
jgi:hypothetical protein